jgi:hypothetical protein
MKGKRSLNRGHEYGQSALICMYVSVMMESFNMYNLIHANRKKERKKEGRKEGRNKERKERERGVSLTFLLGLASNHENKTLIFNLGNPFITTRGDFKVTYSGHSQVNNIRISGDGTQASVFLKFCKCPLHSAMTEHC